MNTNKILVQLEANNEPSATLHIQITKPGFVCFLPYTAKHCHSSYILTFLSFIQWKSGSPVSHSNCISFRKPLSGCLFTSFFLTKYWTQIPKFNILPRSLCVCKSSLSLSRFISILMFCYVNLYSTSFKTIFPLYTPIMQYRQCKGKIVVLGCQAPTRYLVDNVYNVLVCQYLPKSSAWFSMYHLDYAPS